MAHFLDELAQEPNAQKRGRDLETWLEGRFNADGFRVRRNPGSARPRQTDLIAVDTNDRAYLIEARWRSRGADGPAVEELRSRLERSPVTVVGIYVSMSGFASSAIEEVERKRSQPVLLLDDDDLSSIENGVVSLRTMLHHKHESLLVHGRAIVGGAPHPGLAERRRVGRAALTGLGTFCMDMSGQVVPWFTFPGGYDSVVYMDELFDVDWVPEGGAGVVALFRANVHDGRHLVETIELLAAEGWLSNASRWAIRQSTVNWYGVGAGQAIKAVAAWKRRFATLDQVHHTEELALCESLAHGVLCLKFDVSAHDPGRIDGAEAVLQLPGVPVDGGRVVWLGASSMSKGLRTSERCPNQRSRRSIRSAINPSDLSLRVTSLKCYGAASSG